MVSVDGLTWASPSLGRMCYLDLFTSPKTRSSCMLRANSTNLRLRNHPFPLGFGSFEERAVFSLKLHGPIWDPFGTHLGLFRRLGAEGFRVSEGPWPPDRFRDWPRKNMRNQLAIGSQLFFGCGLKCVNRSAEDKKQPRNK